MLHYPWLLHVAPATYVAAFLTALAVSLGVTPLMGRLAIRWGLVDQPGERRVHTRPIPKGGGLGMFLGFAVAAMVFVPAGREFWPLMGGALGMVLLGVIDDRYQLRAGWKFLGQVAIATAVAVTGPSITWMTNPLGGMIYLGTWGIPLTVLWIVAVVNMVNLIDGLDGLAAGVSSIACVPLLVVAIQRGEFVAALLTCALMGSATGFLRYNFNPARLFMGDAGSMFLGYTLAVIAVTGALKGAATIALSVPIVALGVPFVDTACAIVRRVQNGLPIGQADKGHLHHRLLALGFSHRQVVLVIYAATGLLGMGAILLSEASLVLGLAILVTLIASAAIVAHRLGLIDLTRLIHRNGASGDRPAKMRG